MRIPQSDQREDDLRLVESALAGDSMALPELMHRNERWVRGVVFATLGRVDEVDDVMQRVWLTVWQQMLAKKQLMDPAKWHHWLYRLARNAAIDAGRGRTQRAKLVEKIKGIAQWLGGRSAAESADHELMRDESRGRVLRAINGLPPLYREPLVLRHLEGWTYQQIADVLGLPVDTVETRLVRARRLLKESLTSLGI